MKKQETSRFELNKNVRTVLQRSRVDLTKVQFSCMGSKVSMYGVLLKEGGAEFTAQGIEAMVKEIMSISGIRDLATELANWNLNGGSIERRGEDDKKENKK